MEYKGHNYEVVVVSNPIGSGNIKLVEGIQGYEDWPAQLPCTEQPEAVSIAFLNGSMFGWHVDGANPYNCEKGE